MRRSIIILVIGVIFVATFCSGPLIENLFAQTTNFGGVYSLGNYFSKYELSQKEVKGISLRVPWNEIQPRRWTYDWSLLDTNIQKALTYGKKVTIRVIAGKHTPEWVYRMGAQRFQYIEDEAILSMPLPWDEVYLSEWTKFILKLGRRYSGNASIVTVHMTGPCKAGEMHLPEKTNAERWLNAGYTDEKLIAAWMRVIDTYNIAFPRTPLGISIAIPLSFCDGFGLVEEILNYAYGKLGTRLCVQGNWLTAITTEEFSLYQLIKDYSNYINVGFQMLCTASDIENFGGTLREAIDKGLAAGASYLEIYGDDIENIAYKEDIKYADYYLKLNEK